MDCISFKIDLIELRRTGRAMKMYKTLKDQGWLKTIYH